MSTVINEELRYGISALDTSNKEYAQEDELLVRGSDGKMYYKRTDGQIVSHSEQRYDMDTLGKDVCISLMKIDKSFTALSQGVLAYNTIGITGKNNILDSNINPLGLTSKFDISTKERFMFIRVRGTDETNAILSYLKLYHNFDTPVVQLGLTINEQHTSVNKEYDLNHSAIYNELSALEIPVEDTSDLTGIEVSINYIKYVNALDAYSQLSDEVKLQLKELNSGNNKLESNYLDVIYAAQNTDDIIICDNDDKINLVSVVQVIDVLSSVSASHNEFIISKVKPNRECVWGKVLN